VEVKNNPFQHSALKMNLRKTLCLMDSRAALLPWGGASAGPRQWRLLLTPLRLALAAALLLALILGLSLGLRAAPAVPAPSAPLYRATAMLVNSSSGSNGMVTFTQASASSPVLVSITLSSSLASGLHGLHIHSAILSSSAPLDSLCTAAGAHFNPTGVTHTCDPSTGHSGDLGNVQLAAGAVSLANFASTTAISLVPGASNSVLNRAIVLHQLQDDCGLGGVPASLTTGNSGSREVCAVILSTLSA
jgi:Cu-Zn family superoxide dismutase